MATFDTSGVQELLQEYQFALDDSKTLSVQEVPVLRQRLEQLIGHDPLLAAIDSLSISPCHFFDLPWPSVCFGGVSIQSDSHDLRGSFGRLPLPGVNPFDQDVLEQMREAEEWQPSMEEGVGDEAMQLREMLKTARQIEKDAVL